MRAGRVLAAALLSLAVTYGVSRPAAPAAPATWQWIGEPSAGLGPWQAVLGAATTGVDVNLYLLTDRAYVAALAACARRGVPVRVILAANPPGGAANRATEQRLLAGTGVQWRWAPARFDQPYATDHAKYLVVNPRTPRAIAILGSPNGTASAVDGANAEDAVETTDPTVTAALAAMFHADWTGHPAGPGPRRALVLSPGAEPALVALLKGPGAVAVALEELGDAPELVAALAMHHTAARLLLSTAAVSSPTAAAEVQQLARAGVAIRVLREPYLHAKLLVTARATWVGSQNWSAPALDANREVGVITRDATIHTQALQWFDALWARARPLAAVAAVRSSTALPGK